MSATAEAASYPTYIRELSRRLKRGYTFDRTSGGHYRIRDEAGHLVEYAGKALPLPGTPGKGRARQNAEAALKGAGVLKPTETRRERKPEAEGRRVTALRGSIEARGRNRQD